MGGSVGGEGYVGIGYRRFVKSEPVFRNTSFKNFEYETCPKPTLLTVRVVQV